MCLSMLECSMLWWPSLGSSEFSMSVLGHLCHDAGTIRMTMQNSIERGKESVRATISISWT